MAHGREESVQKAGMSLVTNGGVHGFELPLERAARKDGGAVPFLLLYSPRARSPRALTSRRVEDGPQLISLTVQHTNPGLDYPPDKALVEVRVPQADHNVSSREVSKDRQKVRRLLSGLPASKPDSHFVLSVPFSVESPTCRSVQRLSRQTQHGASFVRSFRRDSEHASRTRLFLTHSTPLFARFETRALLSTACSFQTAKTEP